MNIVYDEGMLLSNFGKHGVKLDVGHKTTAHMFVDKGETFIYYLDKLYLFTDSQLVLFDGDINTTKRRSVRAGKLPKTDPELVQYLTKKNPADYIKDQTTEEDLGTLKKIYEGNSWQYRYAVNFWWISHQHNNLSVPQWMKWELVLQKWADEFDKIVRTKKGTKEQIRTVMMWLTKKNDWWIPTGNLSSPAKFNIKKKGEDVSHFTWFLGRAISESPKSPVKGHSYSPYDVEAICNWYGTNQSLFKKQSDKVYIYVGE